MTRENNPDDLARTETHWNPDEFTSVTFRDPIYQTDFVEVCASEAEGKRFLSIYENSGDGHKKTTVVVDDDMIVWLVQELLKQ